MVHKTIDFIFGAGFRCSATRPQWKKCDKYEVNIVNVEILLRMGVMEFF